MPAQRVGAVITHQNKVLLVQHKHREPELQGSWGLPGGYVKDSDASLDEALRREIQEEFSVPGVVHWQVGEWHLNGSSGLDEQTHIVFHVTVDSTDFKVDPQEIFIYRWFAPDELDMLRTTRGFETEAVRRVFARPLNGNGHR